MEKGKEFLEKGIVHNMGRPSYFNERDFIFWEKIYNFIETTDILIAVSGIYTLMRDYCRDKNYYGGGGFQFCFWFDSLEDRDAFKYGIKFIRDAFDEEIITNIEP